MPGLLCNLMKYSIGKPLIEVNIENLFTMILCESFINVDQKNIIYYYGGDRFSVASSEIFEI